MDNSGLAVALLAFGGHVFDWTPDESISFNLLNGFTGVGFNLIDTPEVYSNWVLGHKGGKSEIIIGNWLKNTGLLPYPVLRPLLPVPPTFISYKHKKWRPLFH